MSVHGLCGIFGTLAVGLFSIEDGLFYGYGMKLFLIQLLGVVAVAVWTLSTTFVLFKVLSKTIGLRVTKEEEIQGLDICEHGVLCYPDFYDANIAEEANNYVG